MAQYSFTDFVKTNIAPKEAKYIGVYSSKQVPAMAAER